MVSHELIPATEQTLATQQRYQQQFGQYYQQQFGQPPYQPRIEARVIPAGFRRLLPAASVLGAAIVVGALWLVKRHRVLLIFRGGFALGVARTTFILLKPALPSLLTEAATGLALQLARQARARFVARRSAVQARSLAPRESAPATLLHLPPDGQAGTEAYGTAAQEAERVPTFQAALGKS